MEILIMKRDYGHEDKIKYLKIPKNETFVVVDRCLQIYNQCTEVELYSADIKTKILSRMVDCLEILKWLLVEIHVTNIDHIL